MKRDPGWNHSTPYESLADKLGAIAAIIILAAIILGYLP